MNLENSISIIGIEVDKLFGHYSYKLEPKRPQPFHPLLLLYGDNGSGKSTLSQLLFHALSTKKKRGHCTFLAQTKFRRFSIIFNTGGSITVRRSSDQIKGPYSFLADDGKGNVAETFVNTREDGSVSDADYSNSALREVLSICLPISQSIYFLSDNRILQSDEFDEDSSEEWYPHNGRIVTRHKGDSIEQMLIPSRTRDLFVEPSIWRMESWLRSQMITVSNEGELTTSNIYSEIIKRIAGSQTNSIDKKSNQLRHVVNKLFLLSTRSDEYIPFGLAQPVGIKSLIKNLEKIHDPQQQELVASVLEPYIESIQSRLDAFAKLQQQLNTFLKILNGFYRRKSVLISVTTGIKVFDDDGRPLEVELLSSGEKQLMLLLCNVLCSTTKPSFFIIDEPELSLNVKWQRELIDSLLDLCAESNVQFLMATHSIELLTRHRNSVMRLDDTGVK